MADFKTQITGLTDITIGASTSPTQDEVSQYLVDGTAEVANRILSLKPRELSKFTSTTEDTDNSGVTITGDIYSVMREHDSTSILRMCIPIDPNLRYESVNSDSLHFRSKYNPGYYILDGKVHIVPVAATSNNSALVTQTSYATNTGHSSTAIENFPYEYQYLVVTYAALKTLLNAMGAQHALFVTDGKIFDAFTNANTAIDRLASNIYSGIDNYDAGSKRFKQVKKAMDNAFNLFNGDFPNSSTDTQAFLVQEDPEMIDRSISAIKIELEVATAALTEMSQVVDIPVKEAQMHLAEITSRLGTSQQEYNWYSTRYAALKQEYDAAFGLLAPQQAPQAEQQRKGR